MDYDLRKLKDVDKVGVMGGAFDPIHTGHLAIAEAAREKFSLPLVLFIPSGAPPHKDGALLAKPHHRMNMIELAIRGNKHFKLSGIELNKSAPSYSVDTIKEIRSFMPLDAKLYFIVGADTAALVRTWKEYETIEKLAEFIVLPRAGYTSITGMPENSLLLNMPMLDIASSDIRERIKAGQSAQYLLPGSVLRYIKRHELYSLTQMPIPQIMKSLENTLTQKRYTHTLGVYDEAAKLAIRYGANEKKTVIAALLHDCAKDLSVIEKERACDKYGIKRTGILKANIDLAHSLIGAKFAREKYGIRDTEILQAIKYHTTGRKNMGLIEKIIYVADWIEPGREPLYNIPKMRELAYENLDKAVAVGLRTSIELMTESGKPIHSHTFDALKFYE